MLGTSWECHKVREFALRPMGDFLLVLDRKQKVNKLLIFRPRAPENTRNHGNAQFINKYKIHWLNAY